MKKYSLQNDFQGKYITLLRGNTYEVRTWLKENGAKYNGILNWYFPYEVEVPEKLPAEITPVQFPWESMLEDGEPICNAERLQPIVDRYRYPDSGSRWVGTIGEKVYLLIEYIDSRSICSQFGVTNIYSFKDMSGNVIKTMTARALPVTAGHTYRVSAKVKDHKIYRNEKQTMISYLKIEEDITALDLDEDTGEAEE